MRRGARNGEEGSPPNPPLRACPLQCKSRECGYRLSAIGRRPPFVPAGAGYDSVRLPRCLATCEEAHFGQRRCRAFPRALRHAAAAAAVAALAAFAVEIAMGGLVSVVKVLRSAGEPRPARQRGVGRCSWHPGKGRMPRTMMAVGVQLCRVVGSGWRWTARTHRCDRRAPSRLLCRSARGP